jgi:hypothetical protein
LIGSVGWGYGWGEVLAVKVASWLCATEGVTREVGVALELARLHAPKNTANNKIKLVEINNFCRLRMTQPNWHNLTWSLQSPG